MVGYGVAGVSEDLIVSGELQVVVMFESLAVSEFDK